MPALFSLKFNFMIEGLILKIELSTIPSLNLNSFICLCQLLDLVCIFSSQVSIISSIEC